MDYSGYAEILIVGKSKAKLHAGQFFCVCEEICNANDIFVSLSPDFVAIGQVKGVPYSGRIQNVTDTFRPWPMRNFTLIIICGLFQGCLSLGDQIKPEPTERPNIVLILTDDQGYADLGIYGGDSLKTPNLDRMAREGVMLRSFYVAQAICSASRAAILTGCYPNRIGIHNAFMPDSPTGLNPDETTLAEMLGERGYATAIFGKWHLGDRPEFMPLNQGFDEFYGIPYSNDMWPAHPQQGTAFNFGPLPLYEGNQVIDTVTDQSFLTAELTRRAVDFIQRNKEQPFFLYLPHPQPHVPLFVSDRFAGKSGSGLYGDVIQELDWSAGEILSTLQEEGIDRKTLVIFTSDNGPWLSYGTHAGSAQPFRHGKGTAWEGGHRVPMIMRYPEGMSAGRVLDTPMMNIDILPTLADLTGSPLPEREIDGESAWNLLSGQQPTLPQRPYFFYSGVNELHGVRLGRWKLYFPHTYRSMEGQVAGKGGLPGDYAYLELQGIALYDLNADPGETKNLAASQPKVVREILEAATGMRSRLGDSLLGIEGSENRDAGWQP